MRTVHDLARAFSTPLLAALLLLAGLTPAAHAQVEPIDPVWMVATRDAPLRCGELSTFYKVADLKRGRLVRVDGRSARWARVIYPEDLFGFVKEEFARDVRDGTLTVDDIADIKAPNRIAGLGGSWRSIYLGELQEGTRLEIMGDALSKTGSKLGYRVRPPSPPVVQHPAHAFVQLAAVREATQDEIDAHLAALRRGTEAEPDESENAGEAGTPESAGEATGEGIMSDDNPAQPKPIRNPENAETGIESQASPQTDAAEPPADPGQTADNSLVEEMAIPTADDLAETDPAPQPDADEAPESADAADDTATGDDAEPDRRDFLLWEELENTLTRVRRAGGKTLEESLDELIAEYQRSLTNTTTPSVQQALASRLDWLRLRKSARDQRLALQAALADAKNFSAEVRRERDAWRSARGYDIVGRLVPSAIYDGKTLPRMYRIVAAGEGGLTRTIGYVRDEPGMNLDALAGEVVGVAGEARLDTALRLRVITPTRIDRFRPATPDPLGIGPTPQPET